VGRSAAPEREQARVATSSASPPEGISLERHLELEGRKQSPWLRRLLLCAIAALPVLALLNVFGQDPSSSIASSSVATLEVTAPERLRSGLIFQVKVKVQAHQEIKRLQIAFDTGWWESMSVNSIEPNPSSETSHNGQVVLGYGSLPAGQTLISWVYFQVNPTDVGKRREDISLQDANRLLVRIHRSATIFP
jgi:Mn2+/Fe2+ NRAMP family transporter